MKAYGIRAEPHGAPAPRNAAPERYPTDSPSDDESGAALLSEINEAIAQPCRSTSPGSVNPNARLAFLSVTNTTVIFACMHRVVRRHSIPEWIALLSLRRCRRP